MQRSAPRAKTGVTTEMAIHVEWVDAASTSVTNLKPGELEDPYGTRNERPALVLHLDDAVVIEGSRAELRALAERMLARVPVTRRRGGSSFVPGWMPWPGTQSGSRSVGGHLPPASSIGTRHHRRAQGRDR